MFRRTLSVVAFSAVVLAALLVVTDSAHAQFRRGYYNGATWYWPNGYSASNYGYGAADYSYDATGLHPGSAVLVTVKVPPDASIWFDDNQTAQLGSVRHYISPPIDSRRNFSYAVRARWMEGNRTIDQTRRVAVHSGEQLLVDFTSRQSRASEGQAARPEKIQAASAALAAPDDKIFVGHLVSVSDNQLIMKNNGDGKKHSHTLASDALIMVDGKSARVEDLKPEMKVRIRTRKNDPSTAVEVDATTPS